MVPDDVRAGGEVVPRGGRARARDAVRAIAPRPDESRVSDRGGGDRGGRRRGGVAARSVRREAVGGGPSVTPRGTRSSTSSPRAPPPWEATSTSFGVCTREEDPGAARFARTTRRARCTEATSSC
jgi:hypothetical protein